MHLLNRAVMPSPFPGMDPYLEHPRTWPNLHHRLITAIAIAIAPSLRPTYRVVVEEAIYQMSGQDSVLIGVPDITLVNQRAVSTRATGTVALEAPIQSSALPIAVTLPMPETVRQGYLEIREIATDTVITVLEVLSPANKRSGQGRTDYLNKRDRILSSRTHLVEIDLLRRWEPMPMFGPALESHYRIMVSRSEQRPQADLYAFDLPDPIPTFGLPLAQDGGVVVDLKRLLDEIYEQSGYDLVLDYTRSPDPPLDEASAAWLTQWLQSRELNECP